MIVHVDSTANERAVADPPWAISRRLLGHAGKDVESRTYMATLEFSTKDLADAVKSVKLLLVTVI